MRCSPILILLFLSFAASTRGDEDSELEGAIQLPVEVRSVLESHCWKCHGEKKKSGKLDLRTADSIVAGGKRGSAVDKSKPEASRLLSLVQPGAKPHMPPGKKQLSDDEIDVLASWVRSFSPVDATVEEADQEIAIESSQPKKTAPKPSLPVLADPTVMIDLLIDSGYRTRQITPAPRSDDPTFVRRVYLDLFGRVPTLAESNSFLSSTHSNKRDQLIDAMLSSEEFPQHWATQFDAMLMGRKEKELTKRKQHGWHGYLERVFRDNRPWNEVAREVLLARGDASEDPKQRGHLWFLYERENKHQDIAESIARGFFGIDIACAQCHDHPIAEEIEQAHYWGLVAFFKRTSNAKSENGIALAESAIGGFDSYANALSGSTDETVLTFFQSKTIDESRPEKPDKQEDKDELYTKIENEPRVPKFSRRKLFVDEILHNHPSLARAMVNRVWALLMGRGLVHPLDKMDSKHPPSHPQLLDWLANDFAANEYQIRSLVRAIVNSKPYQLDSRSPSDLIEPDSFAFGLEKPLTAEQLLNALRTSLALDEEFDTGKLASELRSVFPDIVPENQLTTLKQTMMLTNHPKLREVFFAAAKKVIERDEPAEKLIERFYVRNASPEEREQIRGYLGERKDRPFEAMADLLWALATSAEYRFNH